MLDMLTSRLVCVHHHVVPSPHTNTHTHPHPLCVCTSALELTPGFSQLHAVRQNVSSLGVANRKEGRHLRAHNCSNSCLVASFMHLFDFLTNQIFSIFADAPQQGTRASLSGCSAHDKGFFRNMLQLYIIFCLCATQFCACTRL